MNTKYELLLSAYAIYLNRTGQLYYDSEYLALKLSKLRTEIDDESKPETFLKYVTLFVFGIT